MINSWSELYQVVKTWFNSELKFERKQEIEPLPKDQAKMINDLLSVPRSHDPWSITYRRDWYDDPYYKNMKRDDSMWEDQIQQETNDAEGRLQAEPDPVKREARRQELLKKIRAKYGLDRP